MSLDLFWGLLLFAFVSSITPGPNNLMLMASGANFGFRRTVPHMLGVAGGFTFMLLLMGAGLSQVFETYPVLHRVMTVVSVVYMLFLAWKVANAAPVREADSTGSPLSFLQAAAFQWVNPKAWVMAITASTVYAPEPSVKTVVLVALIFGGVNLPSVGSWTVIGQQMARFLTNPVRLAVFNWAMAALLIASLYPVFL